MSITTEVTLHCEACGTDQYEQIPESETATELVEREGWGYADADMLMKDILCPDCLEAADDE